MTSSNRGEREAGIAQDRNKWSKVRTLPVSLSGNGAKYTLHNQLPLFSQWMNFSHTLHFIVKERFTSIYDNRSAIQKYVNLTTSIRCFTKFPVLYVKHNMTTTQVREFQFSGMWRCVPGYVVSVVSKKGVAFIFKGSRSMNPWRWKPQVPGTKRYIPDDQSPQLYRWESPKTRKHNYALCICMSVHNTIHPPNVLPSKCRKFLSTYKVTYTWALTPKFYPVKYLHRSHTLEGKLFLYFRLTGL